eukprot:GILJ01009162.1.p1 GENE.GILJ01009162.1~~GILJ01009162.1.p1  ORF type:complete len:332 (-),score=21.97 GILJ01009162.1:148-1089(-)
MAIVRFSCNDAVLLFAFAYSIIHLILTWNDFHCDEPFHLWLLILYISIILFRMSHFVSQYLSTDDLDPLPMQRGGGPPKWLTAIILGILFPFFVGWTVLGTVWFAKIQSEDNCLPDDQPPWFIILWLVVCYIWIVAYLGVIMLAIYMEIQARRIERELLALLRHHTETGALNLTPEDILSRYGSLPRFADYGIHLGRRGLSAEQIPLLPKYRIQESDLSAGSVVCSICLDEMQVGEQTRLLPCGHIFHLGCVDLWLVRNATCPNCKHINLHVSESAQWGGTVDRFFVQRPFINDAAILRPGTSMRRNATRLSA